MRPVLPTHMLSSLIAMIRHARGRGNDDIEAVVDGRMNPDKLTLWVTRKIKGAPTSNDFAPRLYARLVGRPDGTLFRIEIGIGRVLRLLFAIWLGFVLVVGGVIYYGLLAGWQVHGSEWILWVVPIFMLAGALGLWRFSQWLGREDPHLMLNFLERTVGAEAAKVD